MTFDPQALGRLGITEEQVELMDVAETFCRDTSDIASVREHIESDAGFDTAVWQKMAALGWLGIAIPENYGGVGLSLAEVVPVAEQMGRRMMALPFVPTILAAQALQSAGTESQKEKYLPQIADGLIATLALSELNGSFDFAEIETTATRASGGYALTGHKVLVQNLDDANLLILSAMLDGKLCLFAAEADQLTHAETRREIVIDETRRSYELKLDGVILPDSALMEIEKTSAALTRIHLAGNLLGSAEQVGGAQSCLDYTVDYLKTRKQFGKLIGSYQALKHTIVDAYVSYEKARSLLYAAAHSFEEQGKGEVATRMAAVGSGRALSFAADRAIQFHGGFGFTYDCDAQLYRRRAIFNDSLFGNTRWHKKELARLLFGAGSGS
jgi:alkylation response protein AidB-like acyl-CoA dehydrogenase